jgi:hypothetical protein
VELYDTDQSIRYVTTRKI